MTSRSAKPWGGPALSLQFLRWLWYEEHRQYEVRLALQLSPKIPNRHEASG